MKYHISHQDLYYFTRKSIKKTVMTNPYSAKYLTAFNYFKEAIFENNSEIIEFGDDKEKMFKKFYNFVETTVEQKYFLKNNSKLIIDDIKKKIIDNSEKDILIKSHDSKTNLIYYKLTPKNFDLIITVENKKKRITKKYFQMDQSKPDYNKIFQSIRANIVHYADGLLVRDINRDCKDIYITIHDCFLVDCISVSKFIISANNQSNKKVIENFG
jgi:hypothetical protein